MSMDGLDELAQLGQYMVDAAATYDDPVTKMAVLANPMLSAGASSPLTFQRPRSLIGPPMSENDGKFKLDMTESLNSIKST